MTTKRPAARRPQPPRCPHCKTAAHVDTDRLFTPAGRPIASCGKCGLPVAVKTARGWKPIDLDEFVSA